MKKTFDVTLEHVFPTTRHTVEVADVPGDEVGTALACVSAAEKAYKDAHGIFRSDRKITMVEVENPAEVVTKASPAKE